MTTENWIDLNDIQAVAIAQSEGWEVQIMTNFTAHKWWEWNEESWSKNYIYRGRPRQPKMKEVKILAYLSPNFLYYTREDAREDVMASDWVRQPHLDMVAKIPE